MEELQQNLEVKELHSVAHYNYFKDDSIDGYSFITSNSIKYNIWFRLVSHFSSFPDISPYIYEFIFDEEKSSFLGMDCQIEPTICYILNHFFYNNKDFAIFYICESKDSRHFCRNRLFGRWFTRTKHLNNGILKRDKKVTIADDVYLYSILYQENNPMRRRIEDVFDNVHLEYKK